LGQLGLNHTNNIKIATILSLTQINRIFAGGSHNYITSNNILYSFGSNNVINLK
jgi:hypothetical protein